MDAVQYSAVSRNLAEGHGSFWSLQFDLYNIHNLPSFSEQPPLAFGIQSVFFKLLGSSIYTERIYIFLCMITIILLMHWFWVIFLKNNDQYRNYGWVSIIMWIIMPIVFWTYRHNMMENTMVIFIMLSVIFGFKGLSGEKTYRNLFLSAVFIFLASFTKGLPGLFPLALPFIYYLSYKKINFLKSITLTFYVTLITAALYFFMFILFPEAREYYDRYFIQRTLSRISGESDNGGTLFIIWALIQQLFVPMGFVFVILLIKLLMKLQNKIQFDKTVLFLTLTGLAGVLPMMLTPVQKLFYITPSLPFFGLAFGILIVPLLYELLSRLSNKGLLNTIGKIVVVATLILLFGLTYSNFGKISRDEVYIHDAEKIKEIVGGPAIVGSTETVYSNWIMHCYLIRNDKIYPDRKNAHEFLIIDKRFDPEPAQGIYASKYEFDYYSLYKK